jgi:DNA-binding SARP family transcriptional activator
VEVRLAHLSLYFFGPPKLELDNVPVAMERSKAVALLAYLAITGVHHSRESLATLFWPEYDQQRAYAYLRRTLWSINNSLGEGWIIAGRESVYLQKDQNFYLDVDHFHDLLQSCKKHEHFSPETCPECLVKLRQAAGLYQNDFLAGFTLRDSGDFDEWQVFQTENLRRELSGILEKLGNCSLIQRN